MAGSPAPEPESRPPGGSRAEHLGEALGVAFTRAERLARAGFTRARAYVVDPSNRRTLALAAGGVVIVLALLLLVPAVARRARPAAPAPTPASQSQPQLLIAALPLLLGVFWLFSAWLVDAEARRAFVVQEPWGERRTIAYTALAVGCVFPLILAGLIFSAWGFVTFVLDVSRRQSPIIALQAAALILMGGAGILVLRGLVARWLDQRREARGSRF